MPPNTNPNATATAAATRPRPNATLLIAPPRKNEFQDLRTGRSLRFQPGLWSHSIGRREGEKVSGSSDPSEIQGILMFCARSRLYPGPCVDPGADHCQLLLGQRAGRRHALRGGVRQARVQQAALSFSGNHRRAGRPALQHVLRGVHAQRSRSPFRSAAVAGEPVLTDHFDRTLRVQRHAFRHAAQQEPFDAAMPVRADHNQVGAPSCRLPR